MTRLVGEIHAARGERGRLVRDLKHETAEMLAGLRSDHAEMARRQRPMLRGFVSGLRVKVAGMRKELASEVAARRVKVAGLLKEVATEMASARKVWAGTVVAAAAAGRRTTRGGKGLGSESA
jgi:hypothetical protein